VVNVYPLASTNALPPGHGPETRVPSFFGSRGLHSTVHSELVISLSNASSFLVPSAPLPLTSFPSPPLLLLVPPFNPDRGSLIVVIIVYCVLLGRPER